MIDLELILAKKEDLPRISKLANLIWPDTYREILSSDQMDYMLDMMYSVSAMSQQLDKGHLFYIVTSEGKDIGFFGLQRGFPAKEDLRIHKIYLLPELQGHGIGVWMMNQIKGLASSLKLTSLHLNVNIYNKAQTFYKKYGFSVVKEEKIDIGSGFWMDDVVMKFKIN
ncbi:MAG: GNAT superfamily N-acetyltransferase [Lentimonas sp.]|jgi:GNAT superfamily N-acetyltransferase